MKGMIGCILTDAYSTRLKELLYKRSVSTLPIGGKFCLIDYMLSSMVNSKINNIGIITLHHMQPLVSYLGNAREWAGGRKKDGIHILLPNISRDTCHYTGMVDAIEQNLEHFMYSSQEYIVVSLGEAICKIDFQDVLNDHEESGADITLIVKKDVMDSPDEYGTVDMDSGSKITGYYKSKDSHEGYTASIGTYIMKREFFISLIEKYATEKTRDFIADILMKNQGDFKLNAYELKGYWKSISSVKTYYDCNMDMINPDVGVGLFRKGGIIYTKDRDYHPSYMGENAHVEESITSEGCRIYGGVYGSVLFRGVTVESGSVVKNSIVMEDAVIEEGCSIENVIIERGCHLQSGSSITGSRNSPAVIHGQFHRPYRSVI